MIVKTITEFSSQLREMTHWKQATVLPVKSREVHVSCFPDNYVMRYCHQSVGVISQSFLNLQRLLYKRHILTRSYTPLHVQYVDINREDFTLSLYSTFPGKEVIATKHLGWQQSKSTHIPQLILSTFYAHCTTDIINSLNEESKSERQFQLKGKLFFSVTCIYVASVKPKLQPPSPPPPLTQAYPRHFTPLPSREGKNLIISQPFKLLATQLHVNNQSFSLSVKKPFKQLAQSVNQSTCLCVYNNI